MLRVRAVRSQPAPLSGVHQATIDMQVLGRGEPDRNLCRQVSVHTTMPNPSWMAVKAVLSNAHRVGAARNPGRARKTSTKPTSDMQPHAMSAQVRLRDPSPYFRHTNTRSPAFVGPLGTCQALSSILAPPC
jgi:hypothetical protein